MFILLYLLNISILYTQHLQLNLKRNNNVNRQLFNGIHFNITVKIILYYLFCILTLYNIIHY